MPMIGRGRPSLAHASASRAMLRDRSRRSLGQTSVNTSGIEPDLPKNRRIAQRPEEFSGENRFKIDHLVGLILEANAQSYAGPLFGMTAHGGFGVA